MVVDGCENNYKKLLTLQYTYHIPDSLPFVTLSPCCCKKEFLISGRG
jgi:hypothetical protein